LHCMKSSSHLSLSDFVLDEIKSNLAQKGWFCLNGIDCSDETLLSFAAALGNLDLGSDEQLTGPPIMELKYDGTRAAQTDTPSYFTADQFKLHTDLSYIDHPPRHLLTCCVHPDTGGGGVTLLSDVNWAIGLLSSDDRRALQDPVFRFRYPPGCDEGMSTSFPVITFHGKERTPHLRFRPDRTECPPSHLESVAQLAEALSKGAIQLKLQAGDLLIVDNTRIAHGRSALSKIGASTRHLRRAYAASGSLFKQMPRDSSAT